ncbi:MAG: YciC family protein [Methyloceanibacter sp.]|nr:YciC family protein [Methyloceanibacter sp.]
MRFSPASAIQFGWETFKKRPWFFVGAVAILVALHIVNVGITNGVNTLTGGTLEEPNLVANLVNLAISALILIGAVAFFLNAHDDPDRVTYSALWHPTNYWKFFATSLLTSLAVGLGLVLLIIPGLIAMVLFMFSNFLVVDHGMGPLQALKRSVEITKGNRLPLFWFFVLTVLILAVGILALGVGLLVAVPIVGLATAHAYRLLSRAPDRIEAADARLAA